MTKIVGITGLAGSGKDTLATAIQDYLIIHGKSADVDSFADPIRRIAERMGLAVYDRDKKELETTIRFAHFELSLVDAVVEELADYLGEETMCDVYAAFATILRARGYAKAERQDVLTISPRKFCQLLGTEAGQKVRKTLWVDVLRAKAAKSTADILLLPDVRFEHEARVCDEVIGIERPGIQAGDHASEAGVAALFSKARIKVRNAGTLKGLQAFGSEVAAQLKEELL